MTQDRSGRRAVMHDVARLAGVSHQTVSRVINGNPSVRPETRTRVEQAMAELDYRPNALARGLARRRSLTVGVIGFDTRMWGPSSTLLAVQRAAQDAGYGTLVATLTAIDPVSIGDSVRFLTDQAVDGVIVIAPSRAAVLALGHLPDGLPAVALEAEYAAAVPTVAVDQFGAARTLTRHLISLGHRRIAHLAGPPDWREAQLRTEGYRAALDEAGIAALPVTTGDWTPRSGFDATTRLLTASPTAVFVANDQMALGVIRACAEADIEIPGDLSVAGFDDMPGAEFYAPPLTTVRQDFDEVGRAGLSRLMRLLDDPAGEPDETLVPAELIVRASTSSPG